MSDQYTAHVPTPGVYRGDDLGASRWFASAGFGVPDSPQKAKPTKEYVSGSPWGVSYGLPQALPGTIDDLSREVGPEVYEAMDASDPIISSSLKLLKIAVLSGGVQITSCIPPTPDGTENEPDHELAEEVAQFNCRVVKALRRPFDQLLFEYQDGRHLGAKLGEKLYDIPETGPDAGQIVLCDIKIKPRRSWRFVVDRYMNVVGILAASPDGSGSVTIERDKFAVFTSHPVNSDPRGTSILRSVNPAWNMKLLSGPQFYRFLHLFGSPVPIGTCAENAQSRPADSQDNAYWSAKGVFPVPTEITPEMDMNVVLEGLKNGACASIPFGSIITFLEAQGSGEAFREAYALFNREMGTGILLQARATQEAKHGSKADSETGTDIVGIYVEFLQGEMAEFVSREILYSANVYRFGKEIADRLAPKVTLGKPSQGALIALMSAVAGLESSGYLADSQRPTLDGELGLPVRKPEEINRPEPMVADPMKPGEVKPGEAKSKKGAA